MRHFLLVCTLLLTGALTALSQQPYEFYSPSSSDVLDMNCSVGITVTYRVLIVNYNAKDVKLDFYGLDNPRFGRSDGLGDQIDLGTVGDTTVIAFTFTPTEDGDVYDTVSFADPSSGSGIPVKTFVLHGSTVDLENWGTDVSTLPFLEVAVGSQKKMKVMLTNMNPTSIDLNSFTTRIYRGTHFSCQGKPEMTATGAVFVNVVFSPASVGDFSDSLIITGLGSMQTVKLFGTGYGVSPSPTLVFSVDTLNIVKTPEDDEPVTVTLTNTGSEDEVLVSLDFLDGPATPDFAVYNVVTLPMILEPGGSISFKIAFMRTATTPIWRTLMAITNSNTYKMLHVSGVYRPDTVVVPKDTVELRVNSTHGPAGSTIAAKVITERDIKPIIVGGDITYKYNSTLLVPADQTYTSDKVENGYRYTQYEFSVESRDAGGTMCSHNFIVTMGDMPSTPFTIDAIRFHDREGNNQPVVVTSEGAVVSVDDSEGRTVVDENGLQISMAPSPVMDAANITYKYIGSTATMYVYDAQGVQVMNLTSSVPSVQEGTFGVSLQALAPGAYMLRLSSGDATAVLPFIRK